MPYPLDGEESESSEPTTRIRTSDMAQLVAETAYNLSLSASQSSDLISKIDSYYVRDTKALREIMEGLLVFPHRIDKAVTRSVQLMNNLTIDAVLREVTLTETQRQQIEAMKYEP